MSKLRFAGEGVARILAHAIESKQHRATYEEAYKQLGKDWFDGKLSAEVLQDKIPAGLTLVHDQGIYLMSNGLPRQLEVAESEKSVVVYAEGCVPDNDANPGWWDHCRDLVGGDDFAEALPAEMFRSLGRAGDSKDQVVEIEITSRQVKVRIVPRRKGAQVAHAARNW